MPTWLPIFLALAKKGQQTFCGGFDLSFLCIAGTLHHRPELRMELVLFKQSEGLVMRAPEREHLDAVFLIREDLPFKLRHMLGSPVVGDFVESHLRHHLGTGFGATLRGVKGHDAPRGEVLFVEEIGCEDGSGEVEEKNEALEHKGVVGSSSLPQRSRGAESQILCLFATLLLCG